MFFLRRRLKPLGLVEESRRGGRPRRLGVTAVRRDGASRPEGRGGRGTRRTRLIGASTTQRARRPGRATATIYSSVRLGEGPCAAALRPGARPEGRLECDGIRLGQGVAASPRNEVVSVRRRCRPDCQRTHRCRRRQHGADNPPLGYSHHCSPSDLWMRRTGMHLGAQSSQQSAVTSVTMVPQSAVTCRRRWRSPVPRSTP